MEINLSKGGVLKSNLDIETALRKMLAYYEYWRGGNPKIFDNVSITDKEIVKHLKTDIYKKKYQKDT